MPAKKPERTRPAKTAILIVDDHPMLRRGLAALIESEPDLAVCGEASTCQAALQAIRQGNPIWSSSISGSRGVTAWI